MENQEHFGRLTDRMQAFREEVLDEKPYVEAERAVLATEAYRTHQNQPRVMMRALMLQKVLGEMSIYIEDKTLIAGNQAGKNRNAPVFPEYTMEFILNELDLFEKRDGDVFYITEETKEQLRAIAPFWENNNLRARGEALLPEEVSVFMETGVFGMEGKLNAGDAHLAVNYGRVLQEGLKGYEARVRKLRGELDLTLVACHINHNLRGAEAKRDEDFVRRLCDRLGVECRVLSADVAALAREEGRSVEETARQVRYRFFAETAGERGKIATAHTAADNGNGPETFGLCFLSERTCKVAD